MSKDIEEIIIKIDSELFGLHQYISNIGLDFDNKTMFLNGRENSFAGMIFEDLNEVQIEKAVVLLDSLEILDSKARRKWLEFLEEKDQEVCNFIDMHYNEYGEEIKEQVLEKTKVRKRDNKAFVETLEFGSFHITEGEEEDSIEIVMDYSLIWENGCSFTDQILAMHFNDKMEYEMHTHDS